jgi:hypothetical protein
MRRPLPKKKKYRRENEITSENEIGNPQRGQ